MRNYFTTPELTEIFCLRFDHEDEFIAAGKN
jgi:hypothetical protein